MRARSSSLMFLIGLSGTIGACAVDSAPSVGEHLAAVQSPIRKGAVDRDETFANVGVLWVGSGHCSASLGTPVRLVTANHCIIDDKDGDLTGADMNVDFYWDPASRPPGRRFLHTKARTGSIAVRFHRTMRTGPGSASSSDSARDVAVVPLDVRVPSVFPPGVMVSPLHPAGSGFGSLQVPGCVPPFIATLVGFGDACFGTDPCKDDETLRRTSSSSGWSYAPDCPPLAVCKNPDNGVYRNKWWFWEYNGPLPGDSGGPLLEGGKKHCGVDSQYYWVDVLGAGADYAALDSNENIDFINANLWDFKRGDYIGECHTGTLGDTSDFDGDTVPDACDNCWKVFNPEQTDSDKDGKGDACDPCATSADDDDPDGDGVGSGCDNCKELKNGYKACLTNAECSPSLCLGGGKLAPDATVVIAGPFGKCVDTGAAPPGSACLSDSQCPGGGRCSGLGSYGRCAIQLDDRDFDGVGNACDPCPDSPKSTNSNEDMEKWLTSTGSPTTTVYDVCEPVPVYVSRATYADPSTGAGYDPNERTVFTATRGVGNDGVARTTTAPVGFRRCDCYDPTFDLESSRFDCMKPGGPCPIDLGDFVFQAKWKAVTVGIIAGDAPLKVPSERLRGADLEARTFNSLLSEDKHRHATSEPDDPDRVGPIETLTWFHKKDIGFGTNAYTRFGIERTLGILWSHVDEASGMLPGRDSGSFGRLRQHFEYVSTPLINYAFSIVDELKKPKCPADCKPVFRADLGRKALVFPPYAQLPFSPLSSSPAVLSPATGGKVAAQRFYDGTALDVTPGVSGALQSLMAADATYFLTPVEPAYRVSAASFQFVTMPREWTATSTLGAGIASTAGLFLQGEQPHPQALKLTCSGSSPCARSGARGLYSATWQRAFLIGGQMAGVPTGEVWQYLFEQASWNKLHFPHRITHAPGERTLDPALGDVKAVGFDDVTGRLLILDEVLEARIPKAEDKGSKGGKEDTTEKAAPKPFAVRRLVLLDMYTRDAVVVHLQEHAKKNERVDLVAVDDGSFVLTAQRAEGESWWARRFVIEAAKITFRGELHGEGTIVQPPIRLSEGIRMLTSHAGVGRSVSLDPPLFRKCDDGPEDL